MRMTQETEYAIRIILLCGKNKLEKLSGKFIVENCDIPERWGKIILTKLCKVKILKSTKGKYGGFELKKSLKELTLYDIFYLFENIDFQSDEDIEKYPYKQSLEKVKDNLIENLKKMSMYKLLNDNNKYLNDKKQ